MEYHKAKSKIKYQKSKIRLLAPAKINIGLLVKQKRPDGFHNIETIMAPIKLFDTLMIKKIDKGIHFETNSRKIPSGNNNLVVKAAKLFFDMVKINSGVEIKLIKKIPIGAGLGGGSSDAAYTLLGLNNIFGNLLTSIQLQQLAVKIGMDVPFFLLQKPCYATGRGEVLKPVKIPKLLVALYIPGYGISTKWAYEQLDRTMFSRTLKNRKGVGLTDRDFSLKLLLKRLISNDLLGINALISNTFESVIFTNYPDLLKVRNLFLAKGACAASLSGSGSAVFGIFKHTIPNDIIKKTGIKVIATETL